MWRLSNSSASSKHDVLGGSGTEATAKLTPPQLRSKAGQAGFPTFKEARSIPIAEQFSFSDGVVADYARQRTDLLLFTSDDLELKAILDKLKPLTGRSRIGRVLYRYTAYYIGLFGRYRAVVMQPTGTRAGMLVMESALRDWNPKAVIGVGFGYGFNSKSQQYGDVIIASSLVDIDVDIGDRRSKGSSSAASKRDNAAALPDPMHLLKRSGSSTSLGKIDNSKRRNSGPASDGGSVGSRGSSRGSRGSNRHGRSHRRRSSAPTYAKGQTVKAGEYLTTLFGKKEVQTDWMFPFKVRVFTGEVFTCPISSHRDWMASVRSVVPKAVGGFTSNDGLVAAAAALAPEWIIVMSVGDFGRPDDELDLSGDFFPFAAASAVALLHGVMSRPVLDELVPPRVNDLRTIDFGAYLNQKRTNFTGRADVFQRIEAIRVDSSSGKHAHVLFAEAGWGKSSLLAELVLHARSKKYVLAHHFCQFNRAHSTCNSNLFVQNIAARLSRSLAKRGIPFDAPADVIRLAKHDPEVTPGRAMRALVAALGNVDYAPEEPHFIVLDALDEAVQMENMDLIFLLLNAVPQFPDWLKLLVAARDTELMRDLLANLGPHDVLKAADSIADVSSFVKTRLAAPEVKRMLNRNVPLDAAVSTLANLSRGNFLYISYALSEGHLKLVAQEGRDGQVSYPQIEKFPTGLHGLFQNAFFRVFPNKSDFEELGRPVLAPLAAATSYIPTTLLESLADVNKKKVKLVRDNLGFLLASDDVGLRIDHPSFLSWMAEVGYKVAGGHEIVASSAGQPELAKLGLASFKADPTSLSDYMLDHLAYHLHHAGMHSQLDDLLTDYDWMRVKLERIVPGTVNVHDAYRLLGDYQWASGDVRKVKLVLNQVLNLLRSHPEELSFQLGLYLSSINSTKSIHRLLKQAKAVEIARVGQGAPTLFGAAQIPINESCEHVLTGHTDDPRAVAVLDQHHIVTCGRDETVRIWDIRTFEVVRTMTDHNDWVECVAVIDSDRVVSGSFEEVLRIWDVHTGKCLLKLEGHDGVVRCVTKLSATRLASGGDDELVIIWDIEDGERVRVLKGHEAKIVAIDTISASHLVSASWDMTLRVWHSSTGETLHVLRGHTDAVLSVAVLPDGRICSGSKDNTIRVWNSTTGEALRTMTGHDSWVAGLAAFGKDQLVSGSWDKTVRVWDVGTGECDQVLSGHTDFIECLAVLDGDRIVSGSNDLTFRVWNLSLSAAVPMHSDRVTCINALGSEFAVSGGGAKDTSIRVWRHATGEVVQTLRAPKMKEITAVVPLGDRNIVSASRYQSTRLWEAISGEMLAHHNDQRPDVWCMSTWDAEHIVLGYDSTLAIMNVERQEREVQFDTPPKGHSRIVWDIATITDGIVLTASEDKTLRVWDVDTGECIEVLEGHTDTVWTCAPLDWTHVISGSEDATVKVWQWQTGKCVRTMTDHTDRVRAVRALPDKRHILSGSADGTVRMFRWSDGQCVQVYRFAADVTCMAVADERRILIGFKDGHVASFDILRW